MRSREFKETMLSDAEEIRRLRRCIHDAFTVRDKSEENFREWRSACAEFQLHYDTLAFPGGYLGAHERIVAGDKEAMEAAICFLEIRLYFSTPGTCSERYSRRQNTLLSPKNRPQDCEPVIEKFDEWKERKGV